MINNATTDQYFNSTVYSGNPYKTRCRIYSVDWVNNPISLWNEASVVYYGKLLKYKPTDTDSNGRISQNGIEMTDFFVKSSDRYSIGNVTSKSIKISFINDDGAMSSFHWDWFAVVYLDVYNDTYGWVSVPFGVYRWERPITTQTKVIDAVGNDLISECDDVIDGNFNGIDWSGGLSMYYFLDQFFDGYMGITLDPELANSSGSGNPKNLYLQHTLTPFVASGMTRRDLLGIIAECCGANAYIDRTGILRLRTPKDAKDGGNPNNSILFRYDTFPSMIARYTISEDTARTPACVQVNSSQIGASAKYPNNQSDRPMCLIDNGFARPAFRLSNIAKNLYDYLIPTLSAFHYGTVEFLEYDWRVEAGDIVYLGYVENGTRHLTHTVPVYKQTLTWRGGPVKATVSNWGQYDWKGATATQRSQQSLAYRIYEASQSSGDENMIPTSATVGLNGLFTFKNNLNETLFTTQLPIYSGSIN